MRKTNKELIKDLVEMAKNFPDPTIEHNFDELPESRYITEQSFYGVPAKRNSTMKLNKGHITYTF